MSDVSGANLSINYGLDNNRAQQYLNDEINEIGRTRGYAAPETPGLRLGEDLEGPGQVRPGDKIFLGISNQAAKPNQNESILRDVDMSASDILNDTFQAINPAASNN